MRLAVAIALVALLAAPAAAAPRFDAFAGVSAGVALGTDAVDDNDDPTAIVSVRGGALLRPDFAVFVEGWARICVDNRALGAGVRYWPWRRLWFAGAAGVARRSVAPPGTGCFPDEFKRSTGAWLGAQLGADLMRRKYFSLELALRANAEYYSEAFERFDDEQPTDSVLVPSFALELGISFY